MIREILFVLFLDVSKITTTSKSGLYRKFGIHSYENCHIFFQKSIFIIYFSTLHEFITQIQKKGDLTDSFKNVG